MMALAPTAVLCGSLVGFALGLVGGGGSILATPLLLYVVGVGSPHVAIGTGAVAVTAAALSNFAGHAAAGNIRWRNAILFAIVGALGALVGSTIGKAVDGEKLLVLFGLLMIVVGVLMMRTGSGATRLEDYETRSGRRVATLALLSGFASGFFGIGGGFLIVPCLLFATRMPMIAAIGSSLLAVTAFGITTAVNYARSGLVDWPVAAWFILGGLLGGSVGMRLASRLCEQKDTLRKILAGLIFVAAAYMLIRSVGANAALTLEGCARRR